MRIHSGASRASDAEEYGPDFRGKVEAASLVKDTSCVVSTSSTESPEKRHDAIKPRRVIEHVRKRGNRVQLTVEWPNSSEFTLEKEDEFQKHHPDMLYEYWEALGGRQKATGIVLYHVFRIIGHDPSESNNFLIHWVGCPPGEFTSETTKKVKKIAPKVFEEYLRS
ncbi:hypothetical protein FDECE_10697 [Fusarium decemcellulare]|nr:hypothetical protein FDECE_10697 [Fusarium decemcellulare]